MHETSTCCSGLHTQKKITFSLKKALNYQYIGEGLFMTHENEKFFKYISSII